MRHRFVDEALAEFIAAGRYYNRQVPGLGDAFVDEVEAGIGVILNGPEVWRVVEDDVRRYLVHRFPYGIYYTLEDNLGSTSIATRTIGSNAASEIFSAAIR